MTATDPSICSCGVTTPHVVMRRGTSDNKAVEFWSDGYVTGRLGFNVVARPVRGRPDFSLRANALVSDRVSLYTWAEARKLVKTARLALEQTSLRPGEYLWRKMSGARFTRSGAVVRERRHHSSCMCRSCGFAQLVGDTRGLIPGAVKWAR